MKRMLATVLFVLLVVCLSAIPASEYLIGAYSQYQMRYMGSDFGTKYEALGAYLQNAGFNATSYSVVRDTDFDDAKLGEAMRRLNANNVKTLLQDLSWQNDNGEIGLMALSFGNRLQIEAEYKLSEGTFVVDA
ncbi:MAG: hypothetical protein RBS43_02215 [Candidatus Cloacimonas sp.]|jgi:hypothetical protein|nr:hypothetical protein [Candidatus Cloacimonas sp.]